MDRPAHHVEGPPEFVSQSPHKARVFLGRTAPKRVVDMTQVKRKRKPGEDSSQPHRQGDRIRPMGNKNSLKKLWADDDTRPSGRAQRGTDTGIWRNKRHDRCLHLSDKPQIMPGKVPVKQLHWCGNTQDACLTESLELDRSELGE